jgi:pimeloyl-ACP methyl ester carboxylesterase
MPLSDQLRTFADNWRGKTQAYAVDDLSGAFDRFFTSYVVFSRLYAEASVPPCAPWSSESTRTVPRFTRGSGLRHPVLWGRDVDANVGGKCEVLPGEGFPRTKGGCLVVSGVFDMMIPVRNSYLLSEHLPNAVLLTFPDSGHGSLFQFHESFTRQAATFLASESEFAPY